jgi:hypothetical protein
MMRPLKKPDQDTLRGTAAALQQAYNGHQQENDHVGAMAADADFSALLTQLNDPPPAYRPDSGTPH